MKKSQTKEIASNQIILPLAFIVLSIFLEMTNFLIIGFKQADHIQVFPSEWLFDIGAILIIAGLIYIVKKPWAAKTIFFFFITLQLVLNIVNANIYKVFGDIFTIDYFVLGEEGFAAIRWEFIDFVSILIYLAIFVAIVVFVILLFKFNKKNISLKRISALAFSLALIVLIEAVGSTMYACQIFEIANANMGTIENNEKYLYDSFQFKTEAYKTFGFYGFYTKNFFDTVFGKNSSEFSKDELLSFIEDGKTNGGGNHANDNLIVILCESHEWFAYDPFNTPFIWDLMTTQTNTFGDFEIESQFDANVFTNFYGHNKTNISEGIVLSGNLPQNHPLSHYVSKNSPFDYAYTLPKLFKNAHTGQKTQANYFHTWKKSFYDRENTYVQQGLGFDEYISLDTYLDLEEKKDENPKFFGDWICDSDFVNCFADKFVPKKEDADVFLSCFATMTTHGAYTYENPRFADLYEKYDQNFDRYSAWLENYTDEIQLPSQKSDLEQFRRYKVGAMEFDRTIQTIFNLLQERDRIDDTTIVLYADHNAYYDNLTYKLKNVEKDDFSNIKAHNIPLMIFNSKLPPQTHTQFCNTYDIFPTICEMHGLKYNKNLVHGYNLFSDEIKKSFFASHLGGMFNEKFYSKNIADVVAFEDHFSYEDLQNFKLFAENFFQKQQKMEQIYEQKLANTI